MSTQAHCFSHHFLLSGRGASEEEAERGEEDVHDPNDGHQGREADAASYGPASRGACARERTGTVCIKGFQVWSKVEESS